MDTVKYKGILYFITVVIAATLCIQVYWNFKNYQTSRQQLINDVQTSLDNAVDQYYTSLATEQTFRYIGDSLHFSDFDPSIFLKDSTKVNKTFHAIDSSSKGIISKAYTTKGLTLRGARSRDSIALDISFSDTLLNRTRAFAYRDSLLNPVETLSSKIIVSFAEDELSLQKMDSLFRQELDRKHIAIDYGFVHSLFFGRSQTLRPEVIENASLQTTSKSPYFFHGNQLEVHFTNITASVLKRNLLGMILSFLLVGGIIACLLYLLRIIKMQKQLAEVKNDLISNITHEFKTPIATIGVALESIQNFNEDNNHDKTLRYAKISSEQVEKLNTMVEKLLETATLDSEKLQLKLEPTNLATLLERATQKEELLDTEKSIHLQVPEKPVMLAVDVFHFENAINNIIDNALKYGGKRIDVILRQGDKGIEITVSDTGNSLTEAHQKQVFEKFYRVPKGNTHDVKGFGIGLYYVKKIVEKHGGTITLVPQPKTTFKILFPHG